MIVRTLLQNRNLVISTPSHMSTGHYIHGTMAIRVPALTKIHMVLWAQKTPGSDRSQIRAGVKMCSLRKGDAFVFGSEQGGDLVLV